MFSLSRAQVRLLNVNPRSELSGPDHVPAVDLKMEMTVPNSFLDVFDDGLKAALYRAPTDADSDPLADPNYMPLLRFPLMSGFRWGHEYADHLLQVHIGFSGASDVEMPACKVNKFSISPLDGGSVSIMFRVQGHPDAEGLGVLGTSIGNLLEISLTPAQSDLFDEGA